MPKETIVVVDDEAFARTAVTKVLASNGYKVHAMAGGQEAVNFATTEPFDVLLTDFRMPGGMDGLSTVRAIQRINPQVVAIMMTANSTVDLAVQSLNLGVHGFVVKPFTSHELLKTVQQTLERQRLLRENTRLRALMDVYATTEALITANTDLNQLPSLTTALALQETRSHQAYLFLVSGEQGKQLEFHTVGLTSPDEEGWLGQPDQPLTPDKMPELVAHFRFPDIARYEQDNKALLENLRALAEEIMAGRSQIFQVDGQEVVFEPGSPLPIQANNCQVLVPMRVQGRPVGVLGIRRVGTNRTYTELDLHTAAVLAGQAAIAIENGRLFTRLARIEALREADRLRSEFVSTVSHELRTPLTSIKGYATTLLRDDVNWKARVGQEYLTIISEECDKLMELIDNILEVSKIEAGALRIHPEPIQLYTVLERVINETRRRYPELDLKVDSPPNDELPFVLADPQRIIQVLRNLINNAVKYSPGSPHIVVEIDPHQSDDGNNEETLRVTVKDRGVGIRAEDLHRIFERFYRVDTGPARRTEGTGLGLAICRGIVEAHHGRIWVESDGPGKGSSFSFTLPIVELGGIVLGD